MLGLVSPPHCVTPQPDPPTAITGHPDIWPKLYCPPVPPLFCWHIRDPLNCLLTKTTSCVLALYSTAATHYATHRNPKICVQALPLQASNLQSSVKRGILNFAKLMFRGEGKAKMSQIIHLLKPPKGSTYPHHSPTARHAGLGVHSHLPVLHHSTSAPRR